MAHGTSVDAAPQLAVDEVGEAAEEQADRRHDRHQVGQHEGIGLVAEREDQDGGDHAQQPAMERHAAFPQGQDRQRVLEIEARLVEQHVAEPAAQDDAQRRPQQEVVDLDAATGPWAAASQTRRMTCQPMTRPAI